MSGSAEGGAESVTWVPDLLYAGGRFRRDAGLLCDPATGRVIAVVPLADLRELLGGRLPQGETVVITVPEVGAVCATRFVPLRGRAMLPGMVNAHSHAFQRVIRGRTEFRSAASARDSFWTWREMMYSAAARLSPEDLYDASRMAFVEMALSGITAVGEFHYLHRTPDGAQYDDPNLLSKQVVSAARDAGPRVSLLRVAYARSGFNTPPNDRQRRFIEPDAETFIRHADELRNDLAKEATATAEESAAGRENAGVAGAGEALPLAWAGVAPHSVRAVPLDYLREVGDFAAARRVPLHMHVAEQPAEVAACLEETGRTPVALLADSGILSASFTGVHAVHVEADEVRALAEAGATVCACPTTERNLGDGVVPADEYFRAGVSLALGTDSHAQIDLLEDARELEYHLRLTRLERNVLAPDETGEGDGARAGDDGARTSALAARLFDCATAQGARSLGAHAGNFEPGSAADFFTVDLNDPSIAGAGEDDLLASIVFSLSRTAVRDTAVGSRLVVEDGRHPALDEVVARFTKLQRKLWGR